MGRMTLPKTSEPPRPPNAWIVFRSANAARVKQELQEATGRVPNQTEVTRSISQLWRKADIATKREYQLKAEEASRRHQERYPGYQYRKRWSKKVVEEEEVGKQDQKGLELVSSQQTRTRSPPRMHPYGITTSIVPQSRSYPANVTQLFFAGTFIQNAPLPDWPCSQVFDGPLVFFGSLNVSHAIGTCIPVQGAQFIIIPPPSPAYEAFLRMRFEAAMEALFSQGQFVPGPMMMPDWEQVMTEQGDLRCNPSLFWNQNELCQDVNIFQPPPPFEASCHTQFDNAAPAHHHQPIPDYGIPDEVIQQLLSQLGISQNDSAPPAYSNATPNVDSREDHFAPQPGH